MIRTLMLALRAFCAGCLLLPVALVSAAEPREWVLGQSAPLTGPFAPMGQDFRNGALLAFEDANRRGGVHGKPIRLVSLDDGYSVDKATANARALIDEHRVLCFFNHAGTATVLASVPIAAAAGVPYVGPYTGDVRLYSGKWPQLFITRASFADEYERIFDYIATIGYKTVAFISYDNKVGEEQRRDVEGALKRRGKSLAVGAVMTLGGSVQAAAERLMAASPDAVILNVSGMDAVALIRFLDGKGTKPIYFARSLVGSKLLADQLGSVANGIVISQLVPSPFKPNSPVVKEYRRLLKDRDASARPSFLEFEGFLNAKLMLVALERAGVNATRERLFNALNNLGRIDLGGYTVDFDGRRVGSRYVELTMLRGDGSFAQ